MAGALEQLDAQLDELFRGWNYLSTAIALILTFYLLYPIIFSQDPDTHPLLLSRQANVSAVRQPGESAVYRSLEVPHGFPLKSGLNIKVPGAAKWASGKDGDVRDIWRRALEGAISDSGEATGQRGKIMTIRGTEKAIEHDLDSMSTQLNVIGGFLKQKGVQRVGLYLPNSVELLTAVFAGSFYGFHVVLLPYGKPVEAITPLLKDADVDYLIAAAGSLPLEDVLHECQKVTEAMWVVEETSRDVDWNDPNLAVSTWHDVVDSNKGQATPALPQNSEDDKLPDIIGAWLDETPGSGEVVAFTQKNIASAVGAQVSALPTRHKISPADLFLPADSLSSPYMLIMTFAAVFSNASVVFNSVAGADVPIRLVAQHVAPTIIAASSAQAYNLHDTTRASAASVTKQYALSLQTQALKAGVMPSPTLASRLIPPVEALIGTEPGKLRLVYVFDRTGTDTPPASSARLSDLRAFTGARVVHALTTAKVAGPVAQTMFYDYRREEEDAAPAHFGVPPSCLELQVVDKGEYKTVDGADGRVQGEVIAKGPAVKDGKANLGFVGEFRADGCLSYLFQYPESSTKPKE